MRKLEKENKNICMNMKERIHIQISPQIICIVLFFDNYKSRYSLDWRSFEKIVE